MTDGLGADTSGGAADRGELVIHAPTRLDVVSAQEMRARLVELLESGTLHVLVDLGATTFVDSAGLAALVAAMIRLRRAGGDLTIVRPRDEAAWRVFRLTRFDEVFVVVSSGPGR